MSVATFADIDDRLARRNAVVLGFAQALAGANTTVIVGTTGIIASTFADKSLATLPVSSFVLGMWVGTLPVGFISRRYGRQIAFLCGTIFGGLAGLVMAFAVWKASLVLRLMMSEVVGTAPVREGRSPSKPGTGNQ